MANASFREDILTVLDRYGLSKKSASIDIVSLRTGQSLFQLNPQTALNPASTMKLLTAVAALETLGPTHRYPTELYSYKLHKGGELLGLWMKGYGSPVLVDEELQWIVKSLKNRGVRRIRGPIYVDDSYFGPAEPIRFPGTTGKSVYRVVTGALAYNFNHPESLLAAARSYKKNGSYAQQTEAIPERPSLLNREILDPALFTGLALKATLQQNGIEVTGKVKFQKVPADSQLLLFHVSQQMSDIISGLNKFSNNFIAEQVLRSLGAVRFGNASRERGLAVLEETLQKLGVQGPYRLDNGSGLSRRNRLTATQLTALLRHAAQSPYAEVLTRALSIGGVDGTLLKRFHRSPLKGKIWAKTGTLYAVSALAGYFLMGEEPYAFAILMNGFDTGPDPAERAQRAILEAFIKQRARGT